MDSLWEDEDEELFSQFQATQKVPDREAKGAATPGAARAQSEKDWGILILASGENTNPGLESVYELRSPEGFTIGKVVLYRKEDRLQVLPFVQAEGGILR